MKVLRVRPKHYPEVIDIDCSLESLQKEVEGPIQAVYPWDDEVALICNEEGKLHDDCMEKLNRTLDGPYGITIDIIVGTFLIVGLTEDDFGELFAVIYRVQFRTADKSNLTFDKILMEVSISICGTVSSN